MINDATRDVRKALELIGSTTNEQEKAHRDNGLVRGTTTGGSFIRGLTDWAATHVLLSGLTWHEYSWEDMPAGAGNPICRYFRAQLPEPGRTCGQAFHYTMSVGKAVKAGIRLEVRPHKPSTRETYEARCADPNPLGLAVFALDPTPQALQTTRDVWIILGPGDNGPIPWTWHPGPPARPVTKEHYAILAKMSQAAPRQLNWQEIRKMANVNVHLLNPDD